MCRNVDRKLSSSSATRCVLVRLIATLTRVVLDAWFFGPKRRSLLAFAADGVALIESAMTKEAQPKNVDAF